MWSDNLTDFRETTCEIVATDVDKSTLIQPKWGADFTETKSHEILIGQKDDPSCFKSFPRNTSHGIHCYKPQEVIYWNDMVVKKAFKEVANQGGNLGVDGNVTSTITHQGPNMWIANIMPDGTTLTICVQPTNGADHSGRLLGVAPVQYNWTDNLMWVAREKVGVEYIWETMTLDHWAFGPHHVWTDPETGIIVRMWQPYNGLEVFEPGTFTHGHDASQFADLSVDGSTAPKEARPGGSDFRITCTDDGFPKVTPPPAARTNPAAPGEGAATSSDLRRARAKVPRDAYKGDDFSSMSSSLNKWLLKHAPNSRSCDEWTVEELQKLQHFLLFLRDPQLDALYQSTQDKRALAVDQEWALLNELAAKDPELARIHRDGHCHEAVMWYVHHLPETLKDELKGQISLPLLTDARHQSSDHPVLRAYEEKVTCQDCHSAVYPDTITV